MKTHYNQPYGPDAGDDTNGWRECAANVCTWHGSCVRERKPVLDPADIRVDTWRNGGTNQAVRLTHEPTGVMVALSADGSELRLKTRAIEILRELVFG